MLILARQTSCVKHSLNFAQLPHVSSCLGLWKTLWQRSPVACRRHHDFAFLGHPLVAHLDFLSILVLLAPVRMHDIALSNISFEPFRGMSR
jgi:hypothetical protein